MEELPPPTSAGEPPATSASEPPSPKPHAPSSPDARTALEVLRGTVVVGVLFGVRLRLHVSTVVALPFFAWLANSRMRAPVMLATLVGGGGPLAPTWAWALALTLGLIAAVLVHEAAHAAAARLLGGRVDELTFHLLGGCCRALGLELPAARAVVSAAGPFASIVVGVALDQVAQRLSFRHLDVRYGLAFLAQVQAAFGALQLIPAPPLDGGRVLIALLEGRLGVARATQVAARVGQVLAAALALGGAALPSLPLIGLAGILWAGADRVGGAVGREVALDGVTVRALLAPAPAIEGGEAVATLVARMRSERAPRFVVTEQGALAGVVDAVEVARVPVDARERTPVRALGRPAPSIAPERPAAEALALLRATGIALLPVVEDGALVGVLTPAALTTAGELRALEARPPATVAEPQVERDAVAPLAPVEE